MHEKLHCANRRCTNNNVAEELCKAKNTYYDCQSGKCMTFNPGEMEGKPCELMATFKTNCDKTKRGYKSSRVTKVYK